MIKQLLQVCIFGLLSFIISSTCFAVEPIRNANVYIMGGSAAGLRGASRQDAEATFNVYLSDLFKQSKSTLSVSTVMYTDSKALITAFDRGDIDGFFGTSIEYLSRKDFLCKTLVGIEYKNANIKQRFLIIVRTSDGIPQLKDFSNMRVSLAPFMDVEKLYLDTSLLRKNLPPSSEFFREILDAKSPNIALMDVFFGKSDMVIVRENEYKIAVELNPQLAKKLVILDASEPYIATVGAINKRVSDEEFIGFIDEFNKVATSQQGKKLMEIVSVKSVATVTSDDMNSLQDLLDENAILRKSRESILIKPSAVGVSKVSKAKKRL